MESFHRFAAWLVLSSLFLGCKVSADSVVSTPPRLEIHPPSPAGTFQLRAVPVPRHYLILEQTINQAAYSAIEVLLPPSNAPLPILLPFHTNLTQAAFRLRAQPYDQPVDTDGDGIDDLFELLRPHALNPLNPLDAHEDADGDGISNLQEYLDGTEPAPAGPDQILYFPSLLHLQAHAPAPIPPLLYLAGHDRPEDGWGGWFTFHPHDTEIADGALRIACLPGRPGRLHRVLQPDTVIQSSWWRPPNDGSSNAAPQLQKALDFLATRPLQHLRIHPGRYRIDAQPTMYDPSHAVLSAKGLSDFTIDGAGATLFSPTDGDILVLLHCQRGVVRSLSLEGPGSDRGLDTFNYAAIQLAGTGSDLLFEHCHFRGFMHGISHLHGPKTSTRVTIRHCRFEDGGDTRHVALDVDGAAISGVGDDWTIEDNDIHECARGIEIENTAKTQPIRRVIIRNNRLTQIRNLGIMSFMGGLPSPAIQQSDIQIVGNVLQGKSGRHPRADGSRIPIMHISLTGGHRIRISDNHCEDSDYAAISLYAIQSDVAQAIVSENLVYRSNFRGIQIVASPTFPLRDVSVLGNRIDRCRDRGLLLRGDNLIVRDNSIRDCAVAGIELDQSRDALLQDNVIRMLIPPAPAIHVRATAQDARILDNFILDAALGIRTESPSATFTRNAFQRVTQEMSSP